MPGLTAEAPARAVGRYQLDTEVGRLSAAYADQNERDYQALVDAAKSGRITAEHGL
jgi:hypothetical protein